MNNIIHKFNDYLMGDYEETFDDDWNKDYDLNFDYNIIINNVYNCKYLHNKKYSFPQKKGFTFEKNKYK